MVVDVLLGWEKVVASSVVVVGIGLVVEDWSWEGDQVEASLSWGVD